LPRQNFGFGNLFHSSPDAAVLTWDPEQAGFELVITKAMLWGERNVQTLNNKER